MKKRIISAVLTAALLGSSVSSLTCVSAVESDLTPGIESWQEYSGTRKRISGTVEDVIGSLKSGTVVIDCQGAYGDGFLAFTPDERHSYYTKGSKYSIVTMAEGTEPPVKEINEKIGASDNYEVKFYRIDDSDEYGFFVLDKEYKDTVYDLLKHDSNVVKIEECQNILECESALTNFCIKTDLSIDEVYEEYPGLLLENGRALRESDKDWCDAPEDWSYVFSCKVRKDTETYPSFYSSIKKLHDNNVPFRYDVLIATEYGRQQSATSSELIYNAADTSNTVMLGDIYSDGIIDLSDLSTLSLFLVGDTDLEGSQKKAADVDGDSEITLADLARLRQYLSKKIDTLETSSSPEDITDKCRTIIANASYVISGEPCFMVSSMEEYNERIACYEKEAEQIKEQGVTIGEKFFENNRLAVMVDNLLSANNVVFTQTAVKLDEKGNVHLYYNRDFLNSGSEIEGLLHHITIVPGNPHNDSKAYVHFKDIMPKSY